LGPVGFKVLTNQLDGMEDPEQLTRIRLREGTDSIDKGRADETEQTPRKRVPRDCGEVSG
jgi:hypothetical protein